MSISREARNTLIRVLVVIAAIFFATGLAGHLVHKLDFSSTLLLMFGFVAFSGGITWLTIWDDRRTRERLVHIAAQLAPYDLEISVCKGSVYEVVAPGELFDEIGTDEPLDLDELEAWIAGLRHGVFLGRTWQEKEREARPYAVDLNDRGVPIYVPETEG